VGDDIAFRVYSSRLLRKDKSLVLHGGDNTSVKVVEKDRFGVEEEILYVKGSGWDLETIEAEGFSRPTGTFAASCRVAFTLRPGDGE